MKHALTKDIFREIRKTGSRFVSILIMVMLASMFLCGLRSTSPDMQLTADGYYDQQHLMDLRAISTLGLVEEDVAALSAVEGVALAEGSYSLDARVVGEDIELLVKLHALSSQVNVPVAVEGRLPETATECAVEQRLLAQLDLAIGDTLTLEQDEDLAEQLTGLSYTITGTVESPMYIGPDRGTSTLGDGKVDSFVVLSPAAFQMEYYTEIYLLVADAAAHLCYDQPYDTLIDTVEARLEPVAEAQVEQRYQDIVDEAQAEVDDAIAELNDAEQELAEQEQEGRQELADARAELADARADYEQGTADYEQQIADAEQALAEAETELADGRLLIQQNEQLLATNRQELLTRESEAETQLLEAEQELSTQEAALQEAETQYQQGVEVYEANVAQLDEAKAQLETLEQQRAGAAALGGVPAELEAAIAELTAQIAAAEPQLEAAAAELAATRAQLDEAQAQLTAGRETLETQRAETEAQLDAAWQQVQTAEYEIALAKQELAQGQIDYETGQQELADARQEGQQELADALAELEQGEVDYADGLETLETELADARAELDDAWVEIEDAQAEIASIERGKLYLLDRTALPNYAGYEQDSDRMSALGNVFPVLFFVVAALVCLTTMTRMVEEQRTQIGVLKAMGYGTWPVAQKFLVYGCLAAVIGCVLGCIIGTYAIPWIICTCYGIMYTLPATQLPWHWGTCLGVAAAGIGSTLLAVLWAVGASIVRTPAELMRPKAPKAGKRIFLERITPLWRRMNFSTKVSARNLLRYQKRFWMTVIGVGGCTALIIAGFGLKEGITSIIDKQFQEIYHFDLQVTLDDTASHTRQQETVSWIEDAPQSALSSRTQFSTMTFAGQNRSEEGYLIAALEEETFLQQHDLFDFHTGELLTLPDEGCIVTEKLLELLELEVGDELVIDGDSRVSVPIVASVEQYVYHYVYFSAEAYEQAFGSAPEADTLFVTLTDDSEAAVSDYTAQLLTQPAVAAVTNLAASGESFRETMSVVNYPVMIIILSAAALAFVVLYNLTNINITERMRELATLKVLGFFDNELAMYVYRENIVLTVLGIGLGQLFGRFLSTYMVRTVEIDMVMFDRYASWICYVGSVALSLVFALLVNVAMYYRLKKIDMIESLKSVE